ncbi:hypothetical protein C943_00047 [Mariniradius saccharolyticus AK6]|uniref:Uncharacterized protein n=1 Tax=Mariniradius saccharolyticus AK6 TaxID=1239962 RepID=M7XK81_9BACT|nr:hypothetical protein C943_00047 [Mariniradius saccharolyticus AK6]
MKLQVVNWRKNTLFRVFFDFALMSRFISVKWATAIGQARSQKLAKKTD